MHSVEWITQIADQIPFVNSHQSQTEFTFFLKSESLRHSFHKLHLELFAINFSSSPTEHNVPDFTLRA